jgi:hypothetical protein
MAVTHVSYTIMCSVWNGTVHNTESMLSFSYSAYGAIALYLRIRGRGRSVG